MNSMFNPNKNIQKVLNVKNLLKVKKLHLSSIIPLKIWISSFTSRVTYNAKPLLSLDISLKFIFFLFSKAI